MISYNKTYKSINWRELIFTTKVKLVDIYNFIGYYDDYYTILSGKFKILLQTKDKDEFNNFKEEIKKFILNNSKNFGISNYYFTIDFKQFPVKNKKLTNNLLKEFFNNKYKNNPVRINTRQRSYIKHYFPYEYLTKVYSNLNEKEILNVIIENILNLKLFDTTLSYFYTYPRFELWLQIYVSRLYNLI